MQRIMCDSLLRATSVKGKLELTWISGALEQLSAVVEECLDFEEE